MGTAPRDRGPLWTVKTVWWAWWPLWTLAHGVNTSTPRSPGSALRAGERWFGRVIRSGLGAIDLGPEHAGPDQCDAGDDRYGAHGLHQRRYLTERKPGERD